MSEGIDLAWVVGAAFTLVTMIGGVIARDRQVSRQIRDGDDKLHERVSRIREEYVRRSDLDGHIQRLDASVESLRGEIREQRKETTARLDKVIAVLSTKGE